MSSVVVLWFSPVPYLPIPFDQCLRLLNWTSQLYDASVLLEMSKLFLSWQVPSPFGLIPEDKRLSSSVMMSSSR
uniref:Uncharacterized protein n=1 Tax=Anguilla anguilla TaxID=7936 RepID=A0A0E9XW98_ANGAN